MPNKNFTVLAPLHEFYFEGDTFNLAARMTIARRRPPFDWWGLGSDISKGERDRISESPHWLSFSREEGETIPADENVNLVLLALWMVKPSKAHVSFRIELSEDENHHPNAARLLDRFQWIQGTVDSEFTTDELQQAAVYYATLTAVITKRGRLSNALHLTLFGCFAFQWQVAFMIYAAALETLLTYSEGPGITKRLAIAYACLVEVDATKRDAAFREFDELYGVRSDIMHGRIHNVAANERLTFLARFIEALRTLWRTILACPALIGALEGQDPQREAYIVATTAGYTPPKT
jgi:hypothetical protein